MPILGLWGLCGAVSHRRPLLGHKHVLSSIPQSLMPESQLSQLPYFPLLSRPQQSSPSLLLPQSILQPALGNQLSWKLPCKTAGPQLISAWCTWCGGNLVPFLLQQCPPSSVMPFFFSCSNRQKLSLPTNSHPFL